MEQSTRQLQNNFFFIILIGVALIMFFLLKPFFSALIVALTFSVIFQPLFSRMLVVSGGRRGLAAAITVILIILVVLIPLILIGGLLFNEAQSLYVSLATNGRGMELINSTTLVIEKYVHAVAPNVVINVASSVQYLLQWILAHFNSFFAGFVRIAFGTFLMIIALFYLLKDGQSLRARFISLSPLSNAYDEDILRKLKSAINSIIKGSLLVSVVQGILAAIGVGIFGLANPIIWGVCATLSSLIPGVGTSLVMVPAILYLFAIHHTGMAIGLLIWQLIVVGLVDNTLGPYVLGRGIKVHSFLILLSILGGLAYFGPIGFLLGPLVLALLFALLDIYPLIVSGK